MKSIQQIVDYIEERSNLVENKDLVSRLYCVSREVDREVLERMKRGEERTEECPKFNTSSNVSLSPAWTL